MTWSTRLACWLVAAAVHTTSAAEPAVNPRWRPLYHLAPPHGWMNDPNGFSVYRGEYHLFYQHNPLSSLGPGTVHWGHAKSSDLFHWEDLPVALYPDKWYDKNGVFSGSALVVNDSLVLVYTGNVDHPGETPDHEQHQNLAFSRDGVAFHKYPGNPVIVGAEHQPDFRDPKTWLHNDTYYTVLGSAADGRGRALLYASPDLFSWSEVGVLAQSDGSLGYNFECPDFFELDGQFVLLMSPQGMQADGDRFRNLYQTGYILGDFDYESLEFRPQSEFRELDAGHDLYASQTALAPDGRRVAVAWMDMWEQVYPEREDGWTGMITAPRELRIVDGTLLQWPARELEALRRDVLYSARAEPGAAVSFAAGAADIELKSNGSKVGLRFEWGGTSSLTLSYGEGRVVLARGRAEDDVRRATWSPRGELAWRVLLDRSSVELFCGEGELVFSSRFYPTGAVKLTVAEDSEPVQLLVHALARSVASNLFPLWSLTLLPSLLTLWRFF